MLGLLLDVTNSAVSLSDSGKIKCNCITFPCNCDTFLETMPIVSSTSSTLPDPVVNLAPDSLTPVISSSPINSAAGVINAFDVGVTQVNSGLTQSSTNLSGWISQNKTAVIVILAALGALVLFSKD